MSASSVGNLFRITVLACLTGLQGCVSPAALDHAVIGYDESTSEILSELLLLILPAPISISLYISLVYRISPPRSIFSLMPGLRRP